MTIWSEGGRTEGGGTYIISSSAFSFSFAGLSRSLFGVPSGSAGPNQCRRGGLSWSCAGALCGNLGVFSGLCGGSRGPSRNHLWLSWAFGGPHALLLRGNRKVSGGLPSFVETSRGRKRSMRSSLCRPVPRCNQCDGLAPLAAAGSDTA